MSAKFLTKNFMVVLSLAFWVLAVLVPNALAQGKYPARTISIICPWGAGGATDTIARIVAAVMEKDFGQPVTVVNRTGGGGAVGHTAGATAAPDGYTICLSTTELSMMPGWGWLKFPIRI